jgi:NhaP-type Na+/H+ or K+/H+ antiporter
MILGAGSDDMLIGVGGGMLAGAVSGILIGRNRRFAESNAS